MYADKAAGAFTAKLSRALCYQEQLYELNAVAQLRNPDTPSAIGTKDRLAQTIQGNAL